MEQSHAVPTSRRSLKRFLKFGCGGVLLLLTIAYLAAGLSNAFTPSYRSFVSEAQSSLRTMGSAVSCYLVDHGTCPPPGPLLRDVARDPAAVAALRLGEGELRAVPVALTTPVAYMSTIRPDRFCRRRATTPSMTSAYGTDGGKHWILVSPGPDFCFDILDPSRVVLESPGYDKARVRLCDLTYDPTNGIVSPGDIWRMDRD